MNGYHRAHICKNGHVRSSYGSSEEKFCPKCGEEIIYSCIHCQTPIRGKLNDDFSHVYTYSRPNFCYQCSKPFPWTQQILDNAVELVALDENLDKNSKDIIKNALPDLIVETPKTNLAVAKYKKTIGNATGIIKDAMRNLLVDVVSDTVKKSLFS